jgi:hypothetical protein
VASTIRGMTPESVLIPDSSYRTTWLRRSTSTSSPRFVSTRTQIALPIVPDGTNSAASLPRISAALSSSRFTVGSSE